MSEGSRYFEEKSRLFDALRKITQRLHDLGIPYAVRGGLALFRHGYRRFTDDIGLLVTRADLKTIHEKLEGLGYLPPFKNSKHLRGTELGVKIEFLTTGEYPGDGKAKPVAFPEPRSASVDIDGIRYLKLPKLVELKLASGMTNPGRIRDLSDVLELVKVLGPPREFAEQLAPFVRAKFEELWRQARRRYVSPWRPAQPTDQARSAEEVVDALRGVADLLDSMREDGVLLEVDVEGGRDRARLVTTDPAIAEKYGMVEESEFRDFDATAPDPKDANPGDSGAPSP